MNKRNLTLIITGCILLAIGIISYLVGGYLAGWDFIAWFKSKQAIWIYSLIVIYIIVVLIVIIKDKVNKI